MTALEVRELRKSFVAGRGLFGRGERAVAVDGVSFTVERGETFGLVGESGSGKTTTARMVCRMVVPDGGQVLVDGRDVAREHRRDLCRKVQMVFQDPSASLNPRWKVGRLVCEGVHIHDLGPRAERAARAADLLERCGLPAGVLDRYPHELSGGQRQRVAIARALAVEPSILVLDEPVSALDVSVQAQILVLLERLQCELGLTYLLIAHDLAVVERFCGQIGVMTNGAVIERGAPSDIYRNPRCQYTRDLIAAHPIPDPRQRTRPGGST